MVKLSVIIVSYNVKYYLEQCIHSVLKASRSMEAEIFVVDNASPDQSPNYLRQQFPVADYPQLHIISNSHNVGFGRANNQAIQQAKGEYVLFLNPDTILTENTLTDCLRFADEHQDLGGMGTMMMYDNGVFAYESRRGMPTPWVAFCKMSGLSSLFPHSRRVGKYYMRYLDKEKAAPIEIISGAFLLTRKAVLDKVGGFDEEFFMYGEDVDLSYRFLLAGCQNYYVPSPIIHYKGESTKKNTFKYVHVFYNAMLIFFKKHFYHYWLGLSIPVKLAIVVSAILSFFKQQLLFAAKFLRPTKRRPAERMLYVGKQAHLFKEMNVDWGLQVDYLSASETEGCPKDLEAVLDRQSYVRLIFDSADFSYDYMLNWVRRSAHRHYLGIYHSDKGILITGARVYSPSIRV